MIRGDERYWAEMVLDVIDNVERPMLMYEGEKMIVRKALKAYIKNNDTADTPQTFDKPPKCLGCVYSELDKAFHPCASCVDFSKYVGEVSGDTPQAESKLTANENSVEIPTETENFTSKSREKSKLKQTDCGWK